MVRLFAAMLNIPSWLLVPGILAISFIGVWALNATSFDLYMVVIIGIIGYFFRKLDVPLAPLVLGVVLGNLMEQNLRRALSISNGEIGILFQSNISIGLWILALAVIVIPPLMRRWLGGRKAPAN